MKFTEQRILIFQAEFCGICHGIERAKVVEKFLDKHYPPKMPIVRLVCGDKDGEVPPGSDYEKNLKLSDSYAVEGFPTIIIEGKRKDGSGFEIARASAETVSAFTPKELDRVYREGLEAIEEMEDDVLSQDEASKQIAW